jgi:ABC-type nickel/cobalt efflux system permease component RcnA
MLLVFAFSVGLAVSITLVGLVAVLAKSTFARFGGGGRLLNALPAVSALVIVIAGAAMVARALPKVGL